MVITSPDNPLFCKILSLQGDTLSLGICHFYIDNYLVYSLNRDIEVIQKILVKELEETKEDIWQIKIPKINLIAPISEGTSQEVMLEYVGHFENTSKWEGNIGLAAHNRGYPINYFSKFITYVSCGVSSS